MHVPALVGGPQLMLLMQEGVLLPNTRGCAASHAGGCGDAPNSGGCGDA